MLVILLILGQFLNVCFPHKLFQINQIMLIIMLILQVVVIKEIKKENEEIKKCIMKKMNQKFLASFY